MNTKTKGDISEAAVLSALIKAGYVVLLPWGDKERYDLVVDHNGQFYRVQVKTGRYKNGCVRFFSCSKHARQGHRESYVGQIEYFAVYSFKLDKCYLIPIQDSCETETSLRVEPTKNQQDYKVRWAKDYEINSMSLV